MNRCAFVVPLHTKHFDYGYYILSYLNDKNVDLYFIFTDVYDKNNFSQYITEFYINKFNFLILSDFCDIEIINKTNSFVSIKKLFALSKLYEKYDYISCIDSEIKFINDNDNYYEMMKNIVNSKTICGGKVHDDMVCEINIVKNSLLSLTDVKYHEQLRILSEDFKIYTWWCNIPVYDCQISKEFLEWINFNSNNLDRFNWNIFDDMTYNFFCILIYKYEFKLINNCFHSLEFADSNMVEYVNTELNKLYWVNNKAYCQNIKYYNENDFKIVYHLDRWDWIKPILQNNKYLN